jgi:hypothetical protein
VARGQPIQYLVPDGVADYVAEHGLYRAEQPATSGTWQHHQASP